MSTTWVIHDGVKSGKTRVYSEHKSLREALHAWAELRALHERDIIDSCITDAEIAELIDDKHMQGRVQAIMDDYMLTEDTPMDVEVHDVVGTGKTGML